VSSSERPGAGWNDYECGTRSAHVARLIQLPDRRRRVRDWPRHRCALRVVREWSSSGSTLATRNAQRATRNPQLATRNPQLATRNPLTLSNPNYFGNDPTSAFKSGVPKAFVNQTTYELLRCAGLNPQFDYVEAVVDIKQPTGYSGGICSTGSYEYVRFYADYTNTNVWTDLGLASVRVHDIPGAKPLSYTLRVSVCGSRRRSRCSSQPDGRKECCSG